MIRDKVYINLSKVPNEKADLIIKAIERNYIDIDIDRISYIKIFDWIIIRTTNNGLEKGNLRLLLHDGSFSVHAKRLPSIDGYDVYYSILNTSSHHALYFIKDGRCMRVILA